MFYLLESPPPPPPFSVQIQLKRMLDCNVWIKENLSSKLMNFLHKLEEHISRCGCNFTLVNSNFTCLNGRHNIVIFQGTVLVQSNITAVLVFNAIEIWISSSQGVILILGEELTVKNICLVSTETNNMECSSIDSWFGHEVLIITSVAAVSIFICASTVLVLCFIGLLRYVTHFPFFVAATIM